MVEKYFGGTLIAEREADPMDDELLSLIKSTRDAYAAQMDEFQLHLALEEVFKLIQRANKYIDETAPWVLARDEARKPRLATVMCIGYVYCILCICYYGRHLCNGLDK